MTTVASAVLAKRIKERRLPNLTPPQTGTDELDRSLLQIAEHLRLYEGSTGAPKQRFVTIDELEASGLISTVTRQGFSSISQVLGSNAQQVTSVNPKPTIIVTGGGGGGGGGGGFVDLLPLDNTWQGQNYFQSGSIEFQGLADGPSAISTRGYLWVDDSSPNVLFFRDDAGTDWNMTTGGGAGQLTDLTDVTTAGVTARFALMADGAAYVGRAIVEADVSDLGTYLATVAVTDLDNGTDGELITWDASGVAATVAVGTATHVLTSNGVGVAPTFQVAPSGSGMSDLVDDLSPELGGDLGTNGSDILFADSDKAIFGTGGDVSIYWDGSVIRVEHLASDQQFNFYDGTRLNVFDAADTLAIQIRHTGTVGFINTTTLVGGELWLQGENGTEYVAVSGGSGLKVFATGNLKFVTFDHDGTDFNIAGTTVTDLNFTGFTDITVDGTIDGVDLAALAVTVADLPVGNLADGTDGELITWDAAGAPAVVAVGTATHVLTSNGVGVAPTFQAAAGGSGDGRGARNLRFAHDSSNTIADPGAGEFRTSSGLVASVGTFAFSDTDGDGLSISNIFLELEVGSHFVLRHITDNDQYRIFTIDTITDNGTWWDIDVNYVDGSGSTSMAAAEEYEFEIIRDGKIVAGTSTNNLVGDVPLWSDTSKEWLPSGSNFRVNTGTASGGRVQIGTTASVSILNPQIFYAVGSLNTRYNWFAQAGSNVEGFYQVSNFSGSPDSMAFGARASSVNTDLLRFDLDNLITVEAAASFMIEERAAAATPVAGQGEIWIKTATPNTLWFTDDAGTDFQLGAGSLPTGTTTDATLRWSGSAWVENTNILIDAAAFQLQLVGGATMQQSKFGSLSTNVTWAVSSASDLVATAAAAMVDFEVNNFDRLRVTNGGVFATTEMASGSVPSDLAGDGQIWVKNDVPNTLWFRDDAGTDWQLGIGLASVAVSDLDNGTDGELITWDASGVAATVAVGTATHVLTSNGVGVAPTFQAAAGGGSGVARGATGFRVAFDSSTASGDPGDGEFRLNASLAVGATAIYMDDLDDAANDIEWVLGNLDKGDIIVMRSSTDDADYALFKCTGPPTDSTGWWSIPVLQIFEGSLWTAADVVDVDIQWNNTGDVGMRVLNVQNGNYTFTMADIGAIVSKESGGAGETYTIPNDTAWPVPLGSVIYFNNDGGGTLSIAITTDTLTWSADNTTGTRTIAAGGAGKLTNVGATNWKIEGFGIS